MMTGRKPCCLTSSVICADRVAEREKEQAVPIDVAFDEDRPAPKHNISFSALQMEDAAPLEDEEEDFGGLMVCLQARFRSQVYQSYLRDTECNQSYH